MDHPNGYSGFLLTIYIPAQTKINETIEMTPSLSLSLSKMAERITPISGFIKPKTATLDMGL